MAILPGQGVTQVGRIVVGRRAKSRGAQDPPGRPGLGCRRIEHPLRAACCNPGPGGHTADETHDTGITARTDCQTARLRRIDVGRPVEDVTRRKRKAVAANVSRAFEHLASCGCGCNP